MIEFCGVRMREKTIEHKLVRSVKAMRGFSPKLVSSGTDGMPDRLVLFSGGKLAFVETKVTDHQRLYRRV